MYQRYNPEIGTDRQPDVPEYRDVSLTLMMVTRSFLTGRLNLLAVLQPSYVNVPALSHINSAPCWHKHPVPASIACQIEESIM